eukprot:scaffold17371_cov15-Tisochrysis_lutea.AAC.1
MEEPRVMARSWSLSALLSEGLVLACSATARVEDDVIPDVLCTQGPQSENPCTSTPSGPLHFLIESAPDREHAYSKTVPFDPSSRTTLARSQANTHTRFSTHRLPSLTPGGRALVPRLLIL